MSIRQSPQGIGPVNPEQRVGQRLNKSEDAVNDPIDDTTVRNLTDAEMRAVAGGAWYGDGQLL